MFWLRTQLFSPECVLKRFPPFGQEVLNLVVDCPHLSRKGEEQRDCLAIKHGALLERQVVGKSGAHPFVHVLEEHIGMIQEGDCAFQPDFRHLLVPYACKVCISKSETQKHQLARQDAEPGE